MTDQEQQDKTRPEWDVDGEEGGQPAAGSGQASAELAGNGDAAGEAPTVKKPKRKKKAADERGRQIAPPVCPYHQKDCVARHSSPFFTYYYCPLPGCAFSHKQARPNMPMRLPRAADEQDQSAR